MATLTPAIGKNALAVINSHDLSPGHKPMTPACPKAGQI